MARLFRCYNCPDTQGIPGRDFVIESGPPICPFCTLDGTPGKEHANMIVARRTVHYDPKHPIVKCRGIGNPVCGAVRVAGTAMTGNPNAANCPACRATPVFQEELAEFSVGADDFVVPDDFSLDVDPASEQYRKEPRPEQ